VTEKLKALLEDVRIPELADRLVNSPYAFAAWRLPQTDELHLVVDLSQVGQTETPLHLLDEGFVVNAFLDHHPPKPYHIKADLVFSSGEPARIHPRVNAQALDGFLGHMQAPEQVYQSVHSPAPSVTSQFDGLVEKAIVGIREGAMEKVVLSGFEDKVLPEGFSIGNCFETMCARYPNGFCTITRIRGGAVWLGASPELLVSDDGQEFHTAALAGTKPLGDLALSEIAWTQKEIEEQAMVSRYIIDCFKKIRLREFHEHGPKTVKAASLAHLKTEFWVDMAEVDFPDLAERMLELLHPTSAVCGMPLAPALAFIREHEGYDREFYSGFLGPVNYQGATRLFVNLRCMKIADGLARLYAGAGITEDSNPAKEWEEIRLKMQTMKNLLES
jgi:isochorismate synthase